MKLYDLPLSPNAKRIRVLAKELGIPMEVASLDFQKGENRTAQYLAKNPMGKVPTLEDDGLVLWESPAILIHLARKHGRKLFPAEGEVEALRWMFWNASHFEMAIFVVALEKFFKPRFMNATPDPARVEAGTKDFERYAPVLNAHLESRRWIVGDDFTIADLAVGTSYDLAPMIGLENDSHRWLAAWYQRVRARASWS
jgi:glutathione S-transferase